MSSQLDLADLKKSINKPCVRFRDPRVAIENIPFFAIDQGGKSIDVRRSNSNNYSPTQITFNDLSTGGTGMLIDRKVFVEYDYRVNLRVDTTGRGVGDSLYGDGQRFVVEVAAEDDSVRFETAGIADVVGPPFVRGITSAERCQSSLNGILQLVGLEGQYRRVGPRCLGLMQSTKTLAVVINGNTLSTKPNQYINAIEWYGNHGGHCHSDYSKCASYPDLFKTYREAFGKQTNPLAPYGESLTRDARGAFWSVNDSITTAVNPAILNATPLNGWYCIDGFAFEIVARAGTVTTIGRVKFVESYAQGSLNANFGGIGGFESKEKPIKMVEPILLPIFNHGDPSGRALIGVNKLAIDITFADIDRQWFSGDVVNIAGKFVGDRPHGIIVGIEIDRDPNGAALHYTIIEPKEIPDLPLVNAYSNKRIDVNQRSLGTMTVGSPKTDIYSQNINISTIPDRIYIFVSEKGDIREIQDTDTFCRIDKFSFQFNSAGYQFSSATTEELYQMSREAGLKMTLPQWRDHVGSVLCVDFSKQVNMGLDFYPGMIGSLHFNFSLTATKLVEKSSNEMYLWCVTVEDGVVTIADQSMQYTLGIQQVNPLDVPVKYPSYEQRMLNMYGGLSLSDVKRYASKAVTGLQSAMKYGEDHIIPGVKKAYEYGKIAAPYAAKALSMIAPLLLAAGMSEAEGIRMLEAEGVDRTVKKLTKRVAAGGIVGGKTSKKRGGGLVGGRQTTKSEMSRYLTEY